MAVYGIVIYLPPSTVCPPFACSIWSALALQNQVLGFDGPAGLLGQAPGVLGLMCGGVFANMALAAELSPIIRRWSIR